MDKKVGLIIGFVIYLGVAFWEMGQGYSVGVSLMWPLGIVYLVLFGWASLRTRK